MRGGRLKIFYNELMVPKDIGASYSSSPLKPKLFYDALHAKHPDLVDTVSDFEPFGVQDYLTAHTKTYIKALTEGIKPRCEGSGIPWSEDLVRSIGYTTSSLYHAIKRAVNNPNDVCISPVAGFHHAKPTGGSGFCTVSGQVIASTKIFWDIGGAGAYVDLDAHRGNSIEDSRKFTLGLNRAVPPGCNINPVGLGQDDYLLELSIALDNLKPLVESGQIKYVVFCHGADSHIDDDMGDGILDEVHWLEASKIFYKWINEFEKPVPLVICLFGGYRRDAYEKVIDLHVQDVEICAEVMRLKNL